MNKRNVVPMALIAAMLLVPTAYSTATLGSVAEQDYMATELLWEPTSSQSNSGVPDYMATEFVWVPMHSETIASN